MMLGAYFDEESSLSSQKLVAERTALPQLNSIQASSPAVAKMQESVGTDATGESQRHIEQRLIYDLRYGADSPLAS